MIKETFLPSQDGPGPVIVDDKEIDFTGAGETKEPSSG
jgi:hypothetical protein